MGPPHGGSWVLLPCVNNPIFPPGFIHYNCIIHQQAGRCWTWKTWWILHDNWKFHPGEKPSERQLSMLRWKILKRVAQSCCCILTMLSRGKFLARFCKLLPEVKEFLRQSEDAVYAQLGDEQWLMDLAFLTELTGILNALNLELQGKKQNYNWHDRCCEHCKRKLQLLLTRLQRQDLR